MHGYYPTMMPMREPVPMAQVYPPTRSYSLAKLNYLRDYGAIYDRVPDNNKSGGKHQTRPMKKFDQIRRQQSYDADAIRKMVQPHHRRPEGFDSLQLLGAHNDDRYLEKFMEVPSSGRGRPMTREKHPEPTKQDKNNNKSTLISNKSNNSKNSSNSGKSNGSGSNKENNGKNIKGVANSLSSEILLLLGSMKSSSSVDNIYESVEQIHYRKSMEMLRRREKVRSVHKTGHPLFDHLREERALAAADDVDKQQQHKRLSRSAGPSRKTSVTTLPNSSGPNSPTYSSSPSSGDEQEYVVRRNNNKNINNNNGKAYHIQPPPHHHRSSRGLAEGYNSNNVVNTSRGLTTSKSAMTLQHYHQQQEQDQQMKHYQHYRNKTQHHSPTWKKNGGSATGSEESEDEWVIPRPKIAGGRRRGPADHPSGPVRPSTTDESSDSSSKSSPMR